MFDCLTIFKRVSTYCFLKKKKKHKNGTYKFDVRFELNNAFIQLKC